MKKRDAQKTKNNKYINLFIFYLALPLMGIVVLISLYQYFMPSNVPEGVLQKPKATPIAGYEIIYPNWIAVGKLNRRNFYYLSTKRQVIYRFDADRYLELQGENCSGLIWYIDTKQNIRTRINRTFFNDYRLPTFPYIHPAKNYIGIPLNDMSGVVYSVDQGRHFVFARVVNYSAAPPDQVERFVAVDGPDYQGPMLYSGSMRVSGSTGYFVMKDGDIVFGSSQNYDKLKSAYISEDIAQRYYSKNALLDPEIRNFLIKIEADAFATFEFLARVKVPDAEPYQGWDHIRCVPGAEK